MDATNDDHRISDALDFVCGHWEAAGLTTNDTDDSGVFGIWITPAGLIKMAALCRTGSAMAGFLRELAAGAADGRMVMHGSGTETLCVLPEGWREM